MRSVDARSQGYLPALTFSKSVSWWFSIYISMMKGSNLDIFKLCSVEPWGFCTGEKRGIEDMFSLTFHLNKDLNCSTSLKTTTIVYVTPGINPRSFTFFDFSLVFLFFPFTIYFGILSSQPVVLQQQKQVVFSNLSSLGIGRASCFKQPLRSYRRAELDLCLWGTAPSPGPDYHKVFTDIRKNWLKVGQHAWATDYLQDDLFKFEMLANVFH